MYDYHDISIVRKGDYSAVYQGNQCINFGNRPVDHNFAERIENTVLKAGYVSDSYKGETTFRKGN